MTKIDQFESAFRSADKRVHAHATVDIDRILLVTDLDRDGAGRLGEQVRRFLGVLADGRAPEWRDVAGDEFHSVGDLLHLVDSWKPDL